MVKALRGPFCSIALQVTAFVHRSYTMLSYMAVAVAHEEVKKFELDWSENGVWSLMKKQITGQSSLDCS